ncbi:hypothetical protein FHW68_001667 [Pseudomonas sp. Tn43]|nr:hypothetical protein [Pseudomonas sp. Tn43]
MLQVLVWGGSFFLMAIMADPIMRETGRASQWVYGALSLGGIDQPAYCSLWRSPHPRQ